GLSQDPTGSAASSISSSSDIAESDERNDEDGDDDEDDDGTTPPTSLTTGIATDHTNNTHKLDEDRYEDHYESIVNDETCTLEYRDPYESAQQRSSNATAPRCVRYHQSVECVETTLINAPTTACELEDSGNSDSANSLDDLCGSHRPAVDDDRFDRHGELTNNGRDHYMVPTRNPRELNERILSLFNPQFLPNFNNMITYVASPPPRSQSMAQYTSEDDNFLFRSTNYRKHDITNSMCFRRELNAVRA
ncbi:LOW QUALITY PROTEIN: uncharacterized protein, partial [Anoplolepis gracilipes]|uniref:LOW QUALITY PROTEIN: uncharacterized protein n=1 Tax=Anoplolepis gracilipes TaxID=354296 RepID=UPI003BA16EDA